jgi:hypothetical protein
MHKGSCTPRHRGSRSPQKQDPAAGSFGASGCGSLFVCGLCLRAAGASEPVGCGSLSFCGLQEPLRLRAAGASPSAGCGSPPVYWLRESSLRAAGVLLSASCWSPFVRGLQLSSPLVAGALLPAGFRDLPARRQRPLKPQAERLLQPSDRWTPAARRQGDYFSPQTGDYFSPQTG